MARGRFSTSDPLVSLTVLLWEKTGSFHLPGQTESFGGFCLRGYSRHREAGASGGRRVRGGEGLSCPGQRPQRRACCVRVGLPRTPNAQHRQAVSAHLRFPEKGYSRF